MMITYARWRTRSSRAFTLLELLIAIAIISLIVSITLPAVQSAREASRRAQCLNNLRQFGIAFQNHEAARQDFPAGWSIWAKGSVLDIKNSQWAFHNFMPELLPYLDQQTVAERYDRRKMFASPENAEAVASVLDVTLCPSAPHASLHFEGQYQPGKLVHPAINLLEIQLGGPLPMLQAIVQHLDTSYSGPYRVALSDYAGVAIIGPQFTIAAGATASEMHTYGLNGMFPFPTYDGNIMRKMMLAVLSTEYQFGHRMKTSEIPDGLSNTVMLVETASRPEFWERGRLSVSEEVLPAGWSDPRTLLLYDSDPDCPVNCSNKEAIYSFHGDVANLLFVDGHVQVVSATGIDPKVLVAMLTPNWGGVIEQE